MSTSGPYSTAILLSRLYVAKAVLPVCGYQLVIDDDSTSQIEVLHAENAAVGDFLSIGPYVYVVADITADRPLYSLSCKPMITVFDRDIPPHTPAAVNALLEIRNLVQDNYIACSDTFFAMPFLVTSVVGGINNVGAEANEAGWVNVYKYIKQLRRWDLELTWTMQRQKLTLKLGVYATTTPKIIDGSMYRITSCVKARNGVGKVTSVAEDGTQTHYYVTDSGITTEVPETRDPGWDVLYKADATRVAEHVDKKRMQHSITFLAPEGAYGHNEVVKVRTDDEVIQSRITAIKIDSGSSMAEYTCGELPTKLTDIIKGDK